METNELRETIRQMLNDWTNSTDEERATALEAVAQ